jgi:hypothetical protein
LVPTGAKPTPPTACVGSVSPIDRQVVEPLSSAQTPPWPALAKSRPDFESKAKWLIRPPRSAWPLNAIRLKRASSPISGPLPYAFQALVEAATVLPRAAIRAFCRSAAAYAPGFTASDDPVRCASC